MMPFNVIYYSSALVAGNSLKVNLVLNILLGKLPGDELNCAILYRTVRTHIIAIHG